jgi:hypothetical protein
MRATHQLAVKITHCLFAAAFIFAFPLQPRAQAPSTAVTSYQYRHVPDDKIEEFIKRETTYWSKVAQKAVDNKKMTFWALLEKIGGYDLPNSSNFLFINTFPDIDAVYRGEVFDAAAVFPGVQMNLLETNSMSTTTSWFFMQDQAWEQATKAKPEKDFNYVVMFYHNSSRPDSFISLERKYWQPFIKTAMEKGQTTQLAWGNSLVLSPAGDNIKFNSVSYDMYATLQQALMNPWDQKAVFPAKGIELLDKIRLNRSGKAIYRVVKVIASN